MTGDATGLLGLSGYGLIGFLCCLLVIEELGIPMPFAPGDFLLVLAGVSITTAHLNPLVVVAAAYFAVLAGAVAGREVFERIGKTALSRIARFLHLSEPVDRLATRLRRGGSAAVFVGRITPGLRVHTTEVSGLVGMPRHTFIAGLAPAVAVYEGVFIGLGAWLGPTAWATIERYAPKPGQLLLLVIIVAASALIGRALAKRIREAALKRRGMTEVHM